jgi:activating signal cointegrator complex subunit 2
MTLLTALLKEKKCLDLPKLLDICAVYVHDNPDLTHHLVNNPLVLPLHQTH